MIDPTDFGAERKLTPAERTEIRQRLERGETHPQLQRGALAWLLTIADEYEKLTSPDGVLRHRWKQIEEMKGTERGLRAEITVLETELRVARRGDPGCRLTRPSSIDIDFADLPALKAGLDYAILTASYDPERIAPWKAARAKLEARPEAPPPVAVARCGYCGKEFGSERAAAAHDCRKVQTP